MEVLAAHQVEGSAVEPAHHKLPVGQGPIDVRGSQAARTRSDAQPRSDQVLGLHRQEALDDVDGPTGRRTGEQLGTEPLCQDVHNAILAQGSSAS